MIIKNISIFIQYILPQHLITWIYGYLAHIEQKSFKNWAIKRFVRLHQIDLKLAKNAEITRYANFNDFFIRQLKPELRPISTDNNAIVSPVDGTISQFGPINEGQLIQAKGFDFSLQELLANDLRLTTLFSHGTFATLYLAPHDYHRIHMPIAGTLKKMLYVPGKLFSLSENIISNIPRIYSRNERVICYFDTTIGPMAMILVGAIIVGSINVQWQGNITSQHRGTKQEWLYPNEQSGAVHLERGAEMGYFKLGSTVIMLFPPNTTQWESSFTMNSKVQFGQKIGNLIHAN